MNKLLISLLIIFLGFISLPTEAQRRKKADKLETAVEQYFKAYRIEGYRPTRRMAMDKVKRGDKRNRYVTVYANESFCAQPFTPESVKRIYKELSSRLPAPYNSYRLRIKNKEGVDIEQLVPNYLREKPERSRLWGDIEFKGNPWVRNLSRPYEVTRGLEGRHLMINASHGRYYGKGAWRWQRPHLYCTTEDILTPSFVYPYLIPMLENAGAVVGTARERDPQPAEAIVDNDGPKEFVLGKYSEEEQGGNKWETAEYSNIYVAGFAPIIGLLTDSLQPFSLGTVRQVKVTSKAERQSTAVWTPRIPRRGRYAVYVSYATLPGCVSDARYTVHHLGGSTRFSVNQQMGGGTWVYLGTFEFDEGENPTGRVELANLSAERGIVTADAVRFGGGMGQTLRDTLGTSRLPRFFEGARYQAQWCGIPDTLCRQGNGLTDYYDDIRSRGYYTNTMSGGSVYMPGAEGKGVPFEMAMAVHSDAGYKADSIFGSLAISTSKDKEERKYAAGISRRTSSDLASLLLTGLTNDLSQTFNIDWTRRELWDRNYGETRMPGIPSAIIETLSHQNYTDMKYGHDPLFKFALARSLYKSILKYVNWQHGIDNYEVQPLPPTHFAARLTDEGKAYLSWQPTTDPISPEAESTGYVIYTRQGDGAFDNGQLIKGNHTAVTLPIVVGVQYDFKVTAVNRGGESFPTGILAVRRGEENHGILAGKRVLIINGFERLSGPAWVETEGQRGFNLYEDIGVPYHYTTSFSGAQQVFDVTAAGREDSTALGFCGSELTGQQIAGNTFDYPALHCKALAETGCTVVSCSKAALLSGAVRLEDYDAVDYICGLERDVPYNLKPYKTFDAQTRQLLTNYLKKGGRLWVSGSYIGSDMTKNPEERRFIRDVLKYDCAGTARGDGTNFISGLNIRIPYRRTFSEEGYAVQSPDVLVPADKNAFTAFAYGGGQSAGIAYAGQDYRIIATGFPFESITDATVRRQAATAILQFLTE